MSSREDPGLHFPSSADSRPVILHHCLVLPCTLSLILDQALWVQTEVERYFLQERDYSLRGIRKLNTNSFIPQAFNEYFIGTPSTVLGGKDKKCELPQVSAFYTF